MICRVTELAHIDAPMARWVALLAAEGARVFRAANGLALPAEVSAGINELRRFGQSATAPSDSRITDDPEVEWMTIAQAAVVLDRTPQAVRDRVRAGRLFSTRLDGRLVVDGAEVRLAAVDACRLRAAQGPQSHAKRL